LDGKGKSVGLNFCHGGKDTHFSLHGSHPLSIRFFWKASAALPRLTTHIDDFLFCCKDTKFCPSLFPFSSLFQKKWASELTDAQVYNSLFVSD